MWHAHGFHQFNTGNRRGTRTIADDLDSFHVAASQMQRVNQPRRGDDGGTVLVIMKNRNVHQFPKLLFDDETFGGFDVFKIDAAKAGPKQGDSIDEFIRVTGIKLKVDTVNIGKFLEQDSLAFHDRFGGGSTNITKPQHGGTV